jgi:serine/threonine-protein phosphatase 2A regulatory subunit A
MISPDYSKNYELIVPILETLAVFEETVVREQSV